MCGIVGYIGNEQAAPILLDGLAKLEYRGYDSAGIAVYDGTKVATLKCRCPGNMWNRPYKMGNTWITIGCQCTSAFQQRGIYCCCSQWNYRKLSETKKETGEKRVRVYL